MVRYPASLLIALVLAAAPSTAQSPSPAETVEAYGAAWSEPDPAKRQALLETAWADDGIYVDPTAEVKGREALITHIGGFLAQADGARLHLTSGVETHHGRLRFRWKMVAADGETTIAEGFDYGELDDDGRLKLIVGFFGPFPPMASEASR